MRDVPLSNCEKEFILAAIREGKRLDGRQPYDFRRIKIKFGVDRGCCQVHLGETLVLAQVSCEVVSPRQTRPSDGILFVNVELSPMASPAFEVGRMSDFGVEVNRILERCLKESRCVDTESLCIISGEKVWQVRVDVTVMNHDGNIIDCASIAAISALAHFRRPDVTVNGNEITIHPVEERDPIPLSVHHMPICVSFSFYEQGKYLLVDPTDKEEKVMDGRTVIGMNKHREICTLQVTGMMLLLKDQVLRCTNIAVVKVAEITELIHKALDNDRQARLKGEKYGFAESVVTESVTANQKPETTVDSEKSNEEADALNAECEEIEVNGKDLDEPEVQILGRGIGAIGEGGKNTWEIEDFEIDDDEENFKEGEVADDIESELTNEKAALQTGKPTVKTAVRSGTTNEVNVWIVGSSIVYWAGERAEDCELQNLGLYEKGAIIYWDGWRGMKWNALLGRLQSNLEDKEYPQPDILIIHLGSNDVSSEDTEKLIHKMLLDLEVVQEMFPSARIVYSELLSRRHWRGIKVEEGEKRKERINTMVGLYVKAKGGLIMRHDDIIRQNVCLFRKDGVHLTDTGNDIFIQDLIGAVDECLNNNNSNTK